MAGRASDDRELLADLFQGVVGVHADAEPHAQDPNPARAKAAFGAMMTMKKIDIATLEAAADAAG